MSTSLTAKDMVTITNEISGTLEQISESEIVGEDVNPAEIDPSLMVCILRWCFS
jgi:hypothetical protein